MKDYLLLIDGSSLLFTQYYGNLPDSVKYAKTEEEKIAGYKDILQTSNGEYMNGIYGFLKVLFKIIDNQNPSHIAIAWDVSRKSFRKEINPDYKGTRKDTPSPLLEQFNNCIKILDAMGFKQFYSEEFEADDYCGSLAHKFQKDISIKIVTKDKDYFQCINDNVNIWLVCQTYKICDSLHKKYGTNKTDCPDKMFNLTSDILKKEYGFTPEVVPMLKGLQGDISDNIKGIPGIGESTAKILSNEYKSIDNLYSFLNSLNEKELDSLKIDWKNRLGLKRSPIPYLLAKSEVDENGIKILKGEEAGRESELLATIKKDINIDISLEALKLSLDNSNLNKILETYEMKSLYRK